MDSKNSSYVIRTDLAKKNTRYVLKKYGMDSSDIKFGVNTADFDNNRNPFFVYKASIIKNDGTFKQSLGIYECQFETKSNEIKNKFYAKTYCVDTSYASLSGNFHSDKESSHLIQIEMVRCNKENPIFANV